MIPTNLVKEISQKKKKASIFFNEPFRGSKNTSYSVVKNFTIDNVPFSSFLF